MKLMTRKLTPLLLIFLISCSAQPQIEQTNITLSTSTPIPTKFVFLPTMTPNPIAESTKSGIPLPPKNHLYNGVFPGGKTGEEDDITLNEVLEYENLIGKEVTWVYFSNNWYRSREFPIKTATWIRDSGSIPFIRLMMRSSSDFSSIESVYTLQNILDGFFDVDLHKWCLDARNFSTNLLVEYGTEVNTNSFPWSGVKNGAGQLDGYGDLLTPDGPERFRDAYRHIIQICRDVDATNITWVFHIVSSYDPDDPNNKWNQIENYYPGDNWIDWIGLSVFGVHRPMDLYYSVFRNNMEYIHPRVVKLAPEKPIIIAELGTAKNHLTIDQVQWTRNALEDITTQRYKNVIGFSWWNEAWRNDDDPTHDTTMRVQDNPELEALFREMVGDNPDVIGEISD